MNTLLPTMARTCHTLTLVCLIVATRTSDSRGQSLLFDASPLVPCHPAEEIEFTNSVPDEKLVEARCQVSVLVTELAGQSLQECLFHFFSPEPHTRVYDYLPKTLLVTDVVGSVRVQQTHDQKVGVEGSLGTAVQGVGDVDIGGSMDRRHAYSLAYDRLPPLETLTAVGTLGRGSGVYFKQRQTSQSSLEGSREFILLLRVPRDWSAGYLRLVCQARTTRSGNAHDSQLAASQSFLLPLYSAGDVQAKQAALDLQHAEMALWNEVASHPESLRRASRPTVVHELSLIDPVVPESWLSQIVRSAAAAPPLPFERKLPSEIRVAVQQYRAAKQSFDSLAGSSRKEFLAGKKGEER